MIRRHLYFKGHVQGVGFRYTARQIAEGYRVNGYVRNLADGRVELVAEGEEVEVRGFLDELRAEMGSYIRQTQDIPENYLGELEGFHIKH